MDMDFVRGLWTLATFLVFVGIVWWAYSGRNRNKFAQAEMAPFDDDAPAGARNNK